MLNPWRLIQRIVRSDSLFLIGSKLGFKAFLLAFTLMLARYLSQEDFGDFQFVSSIVNFLTQPTIVFSMIVTHIGFSFPPETRNENLRWLFRIGHVASIAVLLVIVTLFWSLDSWLIEKADVVRQGSFIVASFIIVANIALNVYLGFLQVFYKFKTIGVSFLIMGVLTVFFGAALYIWKLDVIYAYAIQAAASVLAAIFVIVMLNALLPSRVVPRRGFSFQTIKFSIKMGASLVIFFAMLNMDIIAVKFLFDRVDAGFYLRMEFVGKVFFVAASSLGSILFTKASKETAAGRDPHGILVKGNLLYGVMSAVIVVVVFVYPEGIVHAIFGAEAQVDTRLLLIILSARLLQSYVFILLNFSGAFVNRWMMVILGGLLSFQSLLFLLFHDTIESMAINALIPAALGCICLIAYTIVRRRQLFENEPEPIMR